MTLPFAGLARARARMIGGRLEGEAQKWNQDQEEAQRLFREWATRKQLDDTAAERQASREWQQNVFTEGQREREQARADQAAWRQQQAEDAKAYRETQMQENARLQKERLDQQRELANQQNETRQMLGAMARSGRQEAPLKPVPNAVASAYLANQKQLRTLDDAIAQVGKNKDALGWKAYLPDKILNTVDRPSMKGGVDARAAVADVGSLVIHDRSGAAVTVSEYPRLKPFIPLPTDDHETAIKKLNRMRQILSEETSAMQDFYTPDQGYRGLGGGPASPPVAPIRKYSPHNPFPHP